MIDTEEADPAAAAAVRLRSRLRALMAGQIEAFDMIYHHLGVRHHAGALVMPSANRLRFIAMLLADLAWVHGDHEAHEGAHPPQVAEVEAVKRVYKARSSSGRHYMMSAEQRAVVLAYLEALLTEVAGCADLDEHAPSPTLGREARRFAGDLAEIRNAVTLS